MPWGAMPPSPPHESPSRRGLYYRRSTHIQSSFQSAAEVSKTRSIVGQMYVEVLEPLVVQQPNPIVLIHGDFHTGQIWSTKPDGEEGWASFFVDKGFRVVVVDLPPCGRSNFLNANHFKHRDVAAQTSTLDLAVVELELTAQEKSNIMGWPTAVLHDKWPGTGKRGDTCFMNYAASLVSMPMPKQERQTMGKDGLLALLEQLESAILIGEGSGGNMAWLAADAAPNAVAAVIALEPGGPPGGNPCHMVRGVKRYTSQVIPDPSKRPFGLADIPMTFDPPLDFSSAEEETQPGLDFAPFQSPDRKSIFMLQREDEDVVQVDEKGKRLRGQSSTVRQLIHLQKMPHAVVTAPASAHSQYDEATVAFLRQAGVKVDWICLSKMNIFGNGHLMFLETNSDDIAEKIFQWIAANVEGISNGIHSGERDNPMSLPPTPISPGFGGVVACESSLVHLGQYSG